MIQSRLTQAVSRAYCWSGVLGESEFNPPRWVGPNELESPRYKTRTLLPTRGEYVPFVLEAQSRKQPDPPQGRTPSPAFNAPPRSSAQSIAAPSRCDFREPDAQRDIFLGKKHFGIRQISNIHSGCSVAAIASVRACLNADIDNRAGPPDTFVAREAMPPSSRGLGHRLFMPATGVRIPLGVVCHMFGTHRQKPVPGRHLRRYPPIRNRLANLRVRAG